MSSNRGENYGVCVGKKMVFAACFYSLNVFACLSSPERVTQSDELPSNKILALEFLKDFSNTQLLDESQMECEKISFCELFLALPLWCYC